MRQPSSTPTRPQAWNGYEGQHWADNQDRWDAVNAGFTRPLFDAAEIGASDRVLDIGCGNGLTSRLAAGGAADGRTIGMDLSTPMLARARASATRDGIPGITSWFRRAAEKATLRPCSDVAAGHHLRGQRSEAVAWFRRAAA